LATAPSERQTLFLWALVAEGGAAAQKDIKPDVAKPDRDGLVRLGLLQTRLGARRAVHVELSDRGWAWLAANTGAALPKQGNAGTLVLARLLARLGAYLAARDTSLAEFISAAPIPSAPAPPDLATRLREAYLDASGGAANRQVRLADLRARLADVPRADLDAALLRLQGEGGGLLPLDDPRQITAADRAAELLVGGRPRHLLWLDR
jgi:hypothetical protein